MGFTATEETITKGERTTTTRFHICGEEFAVFEYEGEAPFRPALDITTSHDKGRKMLVTSITRIMLNGRIVRWHMELRDTDPLPEGLNAYVGARIARYSAKALEQRHALILDNLEPHKDALIEWASRATV